MSSILCRLLDFAIPPKCRLLSIKNHINAYLHISCSENNQKIPISHYGEKWGFLVFLGIITDKFTLIPVLSYNKRLNMTKHLAILPDLSLNQYWHFLCEIQLSFVVSIAILRLKLRLIIVVNNLMCVKQYFLQKVAQK